MKLSRDLRFSGSLIGRIGRLDSARDRHPGRLFALPKTEKVNFVNFARWSGVGTSWLSRSCSNGHRAPSPHRVDDAASGPHLGSTLPRTRWVSRRTPSNPTGCCGSGRRRTPGRRTNLASGPLYPRSRRRSAAPPRRDAPRSNLGKRHRHLPSPWTRPRRSRRRGRRTGRDRPPPSGAPGPPARPHRPAVGRELDPHPRSSEARRRPRGGPRRPPAVRPRRPVTEEVGPPGGPSPRT